jgi:predicted nucleotidyltransferase
MRVLGIIAEYDPFHNGHLYHLKESISRTGAEASVVLMSGCFTQRGLPAMTDKRVRAGVAAECGVDLVIELPFVYAAGGAEMFARGAVGIMDGLGVVDYLSFGSESGDVEALSRVAALFAEDSERLNGAIREAMGQGASYPAAREQSISELMGAAAASLMRAPNNILAMEYLRELIAVGSDIIPITVKRAAAGLGDVNTTARVAGASALRVMFRGLCNADGAHGAADDAEDAAGGDPFEYVPAATERAIREQIDTGGYLVFAEALFPHLVSSIIQSDCVLANLSNIYSAAEGLENRLVRAVRRSRSMDEAVRYTKTRRYTETRVRRLILHTVMGLTKEAMSAALAEPFYARVLAFSNTGAYLVRRAKDKGRIPLVTNANRDVDALASSSVTLGYDLRAAELYRLLSYGSLAGFNEISERPWVV